MEVKYWGIPEMLKKSQLKVLWLVSCVFQNLFAVPDKLSYYLSSFVDLMQTTSCFPYFTKQSVWKSEMDCVWQKQNGGLEMLIMLSLLNLKKNNKNTECDDLQVFFDTYSIEHSAKMTFNVKLMNFIVFINQHSFSIWCLNHSPKKLRCKKKEWESSGILKKKNKKKYQLGTYPSHVHSLLKIQGIHPRIFFVLHPGGRMNFPWLAKQLKTNM